MKERIIEFLKRENKTAIQFAAEIGVQPSSISHILSGRNNPSLDFVIKMLSKYPEISPEWVLFGRGEMYREQKIPTLFDNVDGTVTITGDDKEIKPVEDKEAGLKDEEEKAVWHDKELQAGKKKARRIIIFLEDNTFEEYLPG